MNILYKAKDFAHKKHDEMGDVRKYSNLPFWVHTDEVANIVMDVVLPVNGNFDGNYKRADNMIVAAHLHDTLEQTKTTELELIENFGVEATKLVVELTNVFTPKALPNLNREKRTQLEKERISEISRDAQIIKLADIISNTRDIVNQDPSFAKVYLEEKWELLYVLDDSTELWIKAYDQIYSERYKLILMRK